MKAKNRNKDGTIDKHHPTGTNDNVFWANALSVYATAEMGLEPFLAVIPRG
ncbi:MAG: hypothetical protein M1490_03810 [Candidatus Bathyarchaeota archaeon]|nr:hypothetical protein [Candidatus Bathyarchaeota archaeon]